MNLTKKRFNKIKSLLIITLLILNLFALASCTAEVDSEQTKKETGESELDSADNGQNEKAKYIRIKAEEAKAMIDQEEVIILDVRTAEEYEENRIEGALLIPDYEIVDLAEEKLPDWEAKILVYCRTGNRSEDASRDLIQMGYQEVYDFGGIVDWNYKTVSGE